SERSICLRHERGRYWTKLPQKHRSTEESRLSRGLRPLSRRNRRILALAWHNQRRDEEHQHHCLSTARRRFRGEGWDLRKFCPLAPVEVCRGANARGGQSRSGNSRSYLSKGA